MRGKRERGQYPECDAPWIELRGVGGNVRRDCAREKTKVTKISHSGNEFAVSFEAELARRTSVDQTSLKKKRIPASRDSQRKLLRLTYCFGGGCAAFGLLPEHVPVPLPMPCTSIEALLLLVSFTSPATCTDSPTCRESAAVLVLGGIFNL